METYGTSWTISREWGRAAWVSSRRQRNASSSSQMLSPFIRHRTGRGRTGVKRSISRSARCWSSASSSRQTRNGLPHRSGPQAWWPFPVFCWLPAPERANGRGGVDAVRDGRRQPTSEGEKGLSPAVLVFVTKRFPALVRVPGPDGAVRWLGRRVEHFSGGVTLVLTRHLAATGKSPPTQGDLWHIRTDRWPTRQVPRRLRDAECTYLTWPVGPRARR